MRAQFVSKALDAAVAVLTHPRLSLSWVRRGQLARDRVFVGQTCWFSGKLPRTPLIEALSGTKDVDLSLPRAFDRKFGISITAEEACALCAIIRCLKPRKVLEIGTFDGNTTLALAANLDANGQVITVDLPPDFDSKKAGTLVYFKESTLNVTPRDQVGQQFKGHPLARQIQQVYGDSAALDWKTLGGPFGVIFIDGCHSEAYVRSDSLNALANLDSCGAIVWHDYGMIQGVSDAVDKFAGEQNSLRVCALEGTRLALALKKAGH